jgi:hypothetical protein
MPFKSLEKRKEYEKEYRRLNKEGLRVLHNLWLKTPAGRASRKITLRKYYCSAGKKKSLLWEKQNRDKRIITERKYLSKPGIKDNKLFLERARYSAEKRHHKHMHRQWPKEIVVLAEMVYKLKQKERNKCVE